MEDEFDDVDDPRSGWQDEASGCEGCEDGLVKICRRQDDECWRRGRDVGRVRRSHRVASGEWTTSHNGRTDEGRSQSRDDEEGEDEMEGGVANM